MITLRRFLARLVIVGCVVVLAVLAGCSDDSSETSGSDTTGSDNESSTPTAGANDGDATFPDEAALAAWLSTQGGATDAADIEDLYADYECDEANSSFVLVRTLTEPTEGVDTETALHTQVAVDTYLCGPEFTRAVIELTFEPGQANTDLNALVDELVEQQSG